MESRKTMSTRRSQFVAKSEPDVGERVPDRRFQGWGDNERVEQEDTQPRSGGQTERGEFHWPK
jgi:hypothetical protein